MPDKKLNLTLNKLEIGETGIIKDIIHTSSNIKQRLLEMGLTNGTKIKIIRYAPFGDPIEILVRNYHLTIRKDEAKFILVERI